MSSFDFHPDELGFWFRIKEFGLCAEKLLFLLFSAAAIYSGVFWEFMEGNLYTYLAFSEFHYWLWYFSGICNHLAFGIFL